MRRLPPLFVSIALLAACSSSGGGQASAAPSASAFPSDAPNLTAAAQLAATQAGGVTVSPQPGDRYAQPGTEISFRNASATTLAKLAVRGSQSGVHTGTFMPHSDGKGVSWVPTKPFKGGETVTVSSPVKVAGATSGRFTFGVAKVVTGTKRQLQVARKAPSNEVQHLVSRPDLQPPKLTIKKAASGTAKGLIFLAPTKDGQSGPLIMDDKGNLVWSQPMPNTTINSFRVQTYKGKPVLTWWQGNVVNGHGEGSYVIADQTYKTIATVKCSGGCLGDHHDFELTSKGTALITSYPTVQVDGKPVVDGMAQEIDIPTGRLLWEWHALDHVALSESYAPAVKATDPPLDYFHINSIEPDGTGKVLISGRAMHAIYEVSTATGAIQWRLGGKKSDFTMGAGTSFNSQHDARRHTDGTITLFDNGAGVGSAREPQTRGLRLRVDTTHRTVTLVKAYTSPTKRLATSQGNVQVLAQGHVFLGYGSAQAITEFDASGKVLFDATLPGNVQSYRAFRFTWTGLPTTKPDAVVSGSALVASWNGSTQVARWQLLSGPDADHLTAVGSPVTKVGFETSLPLSGATGVVVARARAAEGSTLAVSAAAPA